MQFVARNVRRTEQGGLPRTMVTTASAEPGSANGAFGAPAGLILMLAALGLAQAAGAADDAAAPAAKSPPPSVVVAAVASQEIGREGRFIGNVQAIQSVDLKARVEGFLEQVAFEEGAMVDQGQLLYQIEQAQYRANLDGAEGQAAVDREVGEVEHPERDEHAEHHEAVEQALLQPAGEDHFHVWRLPR